ncbi:leucine-rich_repeat domain-containing protein [Hexamita inflata]|uniref:Leucine-rich repeat domain-containing protein n=1 Tax=Hexamita inflata TaxID=28002 RepID=A0AA86UP96_9EUKA|nr:leucine-rich repeat domain-containing protein [Hexamita inflata]
MEQYQFIHNEESYNEHMIHKYEGQIKNGILEIGNPDRGAPDIINLKFLEKFNIQTLKLYTNNVTNVKLRNKTIKVLTLGKYIKQYKFNLQVDDLELENLEVLDLDRNNLDNDQLYNLAKFKKLHTLDVSKNNVDLTHIHMVSSLTKLYMRDCCVKNIDQISQLVTLKELDLSQNKGIKDINALCQLKSLTKLLIHRCGLNIINQIMTLTYLEVLDISSNLLKNVDSIGQLINLKELDISNDWGLDITPLKDLTGLIILDMSGCGLRQLNALQPLINLQTLDLSQNYINNINELQFLKSLTHLKLNNCNIVSICALRPLMNLEVLEIKNNKIEFQDANINEMGKLRFLNVEQNRINYIYFASLIQHPNYNNLDQNGKRCFKINHQTTPTQKQRRKANKLRLIESPNIQLKENQNQHKSLKTALNNFKQEINTTMNNTRQRQIQFTSNVVRLFQYMNQFGFE